VIEKRQLLLDAEAYAFQLAHAFERPVDCITYRVLVSESLSDSFLINIHISDDTPSTLTLYRLKHLRSLSYNWISHILKLTDAGKPLPTALPDGVDPNIETRPLSATQVAWFKQRMAQIEVSKLVSCGEGAARDGYIRRGWIVGAEGSEHNFDDDMCDEREHPEVIAYFRAVHQLAASVLRARFSLGCLLPHQYAIIPEQRGYSAEQEAYFHIGLYGFDFIE
jgi:hypothetical protein